MEDVLPVQSNELVLISGSEVQENIKKKKNWKGTGKDRVTTFWIKKFTCLHDKIAKAFDSVSHRWLIQVLSLHRINSRALINENVDCPEWLPGERTVMIPKSKNPTAVSEFLRA